MDLTRSYSGLKVCDLSQGIAGPHATMLLAQYGADVVKVEPPGGDWARSLGERFGDHCPHSYAFNLGKRSAVLDLKSEEGRRAANRLVASADVFVESFRPGVAARLGFSYEDVRRINPTVIYASLSGFGQEGPYSQRGTVDALIQGFSGMMVMNQNAEGKPQRQNMTAVDVLAGLYLFSSIGAALAQRERTGEGGYLDISLMQAAAAFQSAKIMEFQFSGGEQKPLYMPAGYLRTLDGAVSLSTMRRQHYEALCVCLDRSDLLTDDRFAEPRTRISNGAVLMEELESVTSQFSTEVLLEKLHAAGVFVERVQDYGDWLADPHVRQAGAYGWIDNADAGRLPLVALPGFPVPNAGSVLSRAPRLGEHTAEVLAELGLQADLPSASSQAVA